MLARQDAVYVLGGNTANLLALWRLHGLDRVLREAWEPGMVMAGMSAGAICWFESCTTDSFGPTLQPLHGGLGFLPGSLCPHYHGEAQRRPLYRRLVAEGALPPGYAVDDGAALVFDGDRLVEVVTSRPGRRGVAGRAGRRRRRDGDRPGDTVPRRTMTAASGAADRRIDPAG